MSNIKINIKSIWFGLLVLYLLSSYFAHDAIMSSTVNSIILYAFLGYSAFAIFCSSRIRFAPIVLWEVLCLALAAISMALYTSFSDFGSTFYSMIVNFILVFILTQMPWNELRFAMILKSFAVSAAGLIVILFLTGNLQDDSETGRLGQSLTGNANILAMMLMVGAMYAIWLLVSAKTTKAKLIWGIAISITYIGMFLSGGRKFIVAPIIFAYILLIVKRDKRGKKHIIWYTVLVAAILIALYQLIMKVPVFYDSIGYRFDGFFALFDDSKTADGSTLLRQAMIEAGWAKWPETPLFGHGFDSFKYYNAASVTGNLYYSHNNFIELLYNQGLVGFAAYYSFYVYLIAKALKSKANLLYKGLILGTIISCLLFEYFAVTYTATPIQLMLFICSCALNDKKEVIDG